MMTSEMESGMGRMGRAERRKSILMILLKREKNDSVVLHIELYYIASMLPRSYSCSTRSPILRRILLIPHELEFRLQRIFRFRIPLQINLDSRALSLYQYSPSRETEETRTHGFSFESNLSAGEPVLIFFISTG